jgi:hypothetical protein
VNCLLLELSAAGLTGMGAATCNEARPLRRVTGPVEETNNPGPRQGLLDPTQETEPPMRLSQPGGGSGGLSHPTAAAAALQR